MDLSNVKPIELTRVAVRVPAALGWTLALHYSARFRQIVIGGKWRDRNFQDLIGVWETTTPSYSDRPFEITAKELSFGIGEGNFNTYPITKVKIEKDPKEQATLYIICYKIETKQEYKFSFYYDPTNQGTIRFKNHREMVWTKKPLSSASN